MSELTREVLDQLAEPFSPDAISFKPGATTGDKKKALALAYVELREYIDRLNQIVGADWSDQYKFISAPTGELISCGLTICGVTRWDIGEKGSSDVNTATSAMAQSFKRACVKFGLGRHLYAVERVWVPYDEQRKQFTSQAYEQLRRLVSGNTPQPGGKQDKPPAPAKRASKSKTRKASNGGNGNKPVDEPMTQFWATVKELGIDQAVAKSYLDKCKGNAEKARDMLTNEQDNRTEEGETMSDADATQMLLDEAA